MQAGHPKLRVSLVNATDPPAISEDEVARMTQRIQGRRGQKPKPLINFDEGENVRVMNGARLRTSQGFVDEVMEDKEKLRVMVQVFGRATPVVLGYSNVEKA